MTKRNLIITAVILILGVLFGGYSYDITGTPFPTAELFDGNPTIRFVDVGQGDCTLITYKGDSVLIDAGPVSAGESAAAYVKTYAPIVDYFIITHPHEDHMGGAAEILENIDVENIIMPDKEVDTKFYENAMSIVEEKAINIIYAEPCMTFDTGNIRITIIDSMLDSGADDNLNNISIVARIDVGSTSIMTVGDAEAEEEMQILQNYAVEGGLYDPSILDCDILKVGHHGSRTSTTPEFFEMISPDICVISCGQGNSYGHPHQETLDLLTEYGVEIYRTDESGTVVLRGES